MKRLKKSPSRRRAIKIPPYPTRYSRASPRLASFVAARPRTRARTQTRERAIHHARIIPARRRRPECAARRLERAARARDADAPARDNLALARVW